MQVQWSKGAAKAGVRFDKKHTQRPLRRGVPWPPDSQYGPSHEQSTAEDMVTVKRRTPTPHHKRTRDNSARGNPPVRRWPPYASAENLPPYPVHLETNTATETPREPPKALSTCACDNLRFPPVSNVGGLSKLVPVAIAS